MIPEGKNLMQDKFGEWVVDRKFPIDRDSQRENILAVMLAPFRAVG